MTDSAPEKLGKYKIIAEVRRGGFAAVYKAVDTTLNHTVALKVLAPHLLRTYIHRAVISATGDGLRGSVRDWRMK